jgi:hypothetical protein
MPDYVVQRIQGMLNDRTRSVKGSTILIYGLAYKANTGDARETPSRPVVEKLLELGAQVLVADPHVDDHQMPVGAQRVEGTARDAANADLVAYLVDHDVFDNEGIETIETPILDCRHALKGPRVEYL